MTMIPPAAFCFFIIQTVVKPRLLERQILFMTCRFCSAPSQSLNHPMNEFNPSHAKAPDASQNVFLS